MRSELKQLLLRMNDKTVDAEDSRDFPQTVSWNAHRDVEKLTDRSIVDELVEYILEERSEPKRRNAHFIIGKIGQNTCDSSCTEILIAELARSKSKYTLGSLLDRIVDLPKPANLDVMPIYSLLLDSRWLVRHSAIGALSNSEHPDCEERILELLRTTEDPFDQSSCNVTLGTMGTASSLPLLKKMILSRKQDVKISAKFAIEAIEKRCPQNWKES